MRLQPYRLLTLILGVTAWYPPCVQTLATNVATNVPDSISFSDRLAGANRHWHCPFRYRGSSHESAVAQFFSLGRSTR